MEVYIAFATLQKQRQDLKDFYNGAAAAINDLLCRLGHGDNVCDLVEQLPECPRVPKNLE